MKRPTRRTFLKTSAGLAWGLPSLAIGGQGSAAPSNEVRMAVIGMGGIGTVGGVGGRGRQLVARMREVPGVRLVALCDVDQEILDHEVQQARDRGDNVVAYRDPRKVLDDKSIDAVAVATPNHWHALATIWACQAGKDVYVEKPFGYDIWEGRQMVAAARKYGRMVQCGTQRRSSEVLREGFELVRSGQIGLIRCARALVYRGREGIGKVSDPTPIPATVDYDLWSGPIAPAPLTRKQLHYDWHWIWSTGNGEIGNNGAHQIDVARWALGQDQPPPRALSIGGRFGFDDDGQTPNTQIAFFDYRPAPLICEIRNFRASKAAGALGNFRGEEKGVVIECEGGYFAGDLGGGTVFDNQGKKIKEIRAGSKPQKVEVEHVANFVAAVRSRKSSQLKAEAQVGHVSAACSHVANVSHRLGKQMPPEAVVESLRANRDLADAFDRCRQYLEKNGIDLAASQAVVGPMVVFDPKQECFVGQFAQQANALSQRQYREPFVVPRIA